MASKTLALKILEQLQQEHGSAKTELIFESSFQLLIAVILSAQCTDVQVNKTTPNLFKKYPTAQRLAKAKLEDVEKLIHSCGFYKNKAKNIVEASKQIVKEFDAQIPQTLEELITLAGVGRKTASVVLNQAFDLPAIAVDTHVARVSFRLGWTSHTHPEKIETDLKLLFPSSEWGTINGLLILHGRRLCRARKPQCELCTISTHCPSRVL